MAVPKDVDWSAGKADIERAVALLRQALRIVDALGGRTEIAARLQGLIDELDRCGPQ